MYQFATVALFGLPTLLAVAAALLAAAVWLVAAAQPIRVGNKSIRVQRYQEATVRQAMEIMAPMGVRRPGELSPRMLHKCTPSSTLRSYAELYEWLRPGQPLASWAADWAADADAFGGTVPV